MYCSHSLDLVGFIYYTSSLGSQSDVIACELDFEVSALAGVLVLCSQVGSPCVHSLTKPFSTQETGVEVGMNKLYK